MSDFLTADELRVFRSFVPWDPPDDAEVQSVAEALGSWEQAALEYVRRKRSEIAGAPSSFTVPGEYSETWNVTALDKLYDEISALVPADEGGTGLSVGVQVRRNSTTDRRLYRR